MQPRYGVDAATVVAVWGVESNYGRNSASARSCARWRRCLLRRGAQDYFRAEFFQTLRSCQRGECSPPTCGLVGRRLRPHPVHADHLQRLAVDFDGDGRRDLVGSVPDALASTANYPRDAGWSRARRGDIEVRLPRNTMARPAAEKRAAFGVGGRLHRVDRTALLGDERAALLLPAGARGPAFLVFGTSTRSTLQRRGVLSLAIAHLSDRLRGGGPFRTRVADRRSRLVARGAPASCRSASASATTSAP